MSDLGSENDKLRRAKDRLIVALDVPCGSEAREIVSELEDTITTYKIGLRLFTGSGPAIVEELVAGGKNVFLDLKFHDIPNTVAQAGVEAAKLGVWMFNVHSSGGSEMMERTAAEVAAQCTGCNRPAPLIIGVTVLTSADVNTMREVGVDNAPENQVAALAQLTYSAGLSGVVASANEVSVIRGAVPDQNFLVVTPGIRPTNATNDDQKRVTTPGSAISAGADHLVVGRPIISAPDRRRAAMDILMEIEAASAV